MVIVQQHKNRLAVIKSVAFILALAGWGCSGSIDAVEGVAGSDAANSSGPGSLSSSTPGAGGAVNGGSSETGGGAVAATPGQPLTCTAESVTATPVRRLSHVEYNRTVKDLFPGIEMPKQAFVADLAVHGFENNAGAMNPSPALIEQYADAADRIAQVAGADLDAVLPCTPSGNDLACGKEFIATFGKNAFRRPLTSEEQGRYEAFFAQQMNEISFNAAVELTVQAFLLSPQFLYRLELGSGNEQAGSAVALDDYAMASRLSYLVWQSMPDAELFAAADKGELRTAEQVQKQARRMLATPAAAEAMVDFHRQWLDFDRVMTEDKDASLFPAWNEALRTAVREESNRFVAYVFGDKGTGSVAELLTSRVSFVNRDLANLYDVQMAGDGWQQVTLPEERAGILTRANFLAGRAHSTNGSPPLRGVAVLDQLLCSRPPPPPPTVNTSLPSTGSDHPVTNRDLFESRTGKVECQGCHKSINGIGYGFEAFDSIGRFRTTDHGLPVDATGELIATTDSNGDYDGAVELSNKLAESKQVEQCAVKNWYRYAMAREEQSTDSCKLDALNSAMEQSGGDVRELVVTIASSFEFMHRAAVVAN